MTATGSTSISYDGVGNPTTYNGYTLTWSGRQLMEMSMNAGQFLYTFQYNDEGIRTEKTYGTSVYRYTLNGTQIVSEAKYTRNSSGAETFNYLLVYLYDENGLPMGLQYHGAGYTAWTFDTYYFEKNLQGDVIAIYTEDGTKIGSYTYDAWGNFTYAYATGATTAQKQIVRTLNPFRYRGYYYDTDTGLYYLQSRYYNPQWGRFLNADGYVSTGTGLLGYNMYAYCNNNPVTGYDPAGTLDWGNLFKGSGWLADGVTAIVVGVSVLTCGVAAPAIMAVAAVTVAAGAATAVNGVSELGEAATGHNFMRDDVFRGNAKAYNTYAHTTAAVAEIGTMVCGGWLKVNAPRIEAYNNVQNYTYADGAAKHVGERSCYDSTLLKKEIIKYGTMTNEGGGVYTFRAAGTAFSNVRQTFQSGIW